MKMSRSRILALISLAILAGCSKHDAIPLATQPNNLIPSITSVGVEPGAVAPGESTQVIVAAIDPDGDTPLTYRYVASGGSVAGNKSTAAWKLPLMPGVYTLSVTVDDGYGGISNLVTATCTVNDVPAVSGIVPAPGAID